MIQFNIPHLTGKEQEYVLAAVARNKLSGNGEFTKRSQELLQARYGFRRVLLTTSCTDALEMCGLLLNIGPGDEVIMPSFTFVSTANAFVLRGARIVFVDSRPDHPGMDEARIEELITERTKAIVVVHYAGVACDMDVVMDIAQRHGLLVVEDAAQAIDSHYKGRPLGGIGHLGAFSFHETKNIQCGEGGALVVNDAALTARAEIIWEKGTNRAAFWRGEVDKYNWVDVGSSFLPSEINAAYLFAQLQEIDAIQARRKAIWETYFNGLQDLFDRGDLASPIVPPYATRNGHLFHIVCASLDERDRLMAHLRASGVNAVFHYQSLHTSPFYAAKHDGRALPMSDRYSDRLLRLPLFLGMTEEQQSHVIRSVNAFYGK
jgi:dTDP-4-amino-4,6-dideoxygalactose transaminase